MRSIVVLALGVVASSSFGAIWTSGFETQDFSEWTGLTSTESEVQTIDSTQFNSGSFSALSPGANVDGTSSLNRTFANIGAIDANQTIRLSFWMKLNAANAGNRHYAEIRSYSGEAYNTGAFEQLIAVGAFNGATNVIDGNGGIVTGSNTGKWQARLAFGGYANGGWFQLNQAANRTTNWTKFEIEIAQSGVQFFVDGQAGLATALTRGGATWTADSVIMGSGLTSAGVTANFDDFSVDAVPEPASLLVLAGVGALAARRRRKA